jgi:hypothetical protein
MRRDEFIKASNKAFDEANRTKSGWITVIICNRSKIFTDEVFYDDEDAIFLMDNTFIAKIKYRDIKDIKITSDDDLFDDKEIFIDGGDEE